MSGRDTHVQTEVAARCEGCEWFASAANAQGLAAQHHDRSGHTVLVDIERSVRYGGGTSGEHRHAQLVAGGQAVLDVG